jgi:glycosyltransferase involved in cell wall biosynthesis
LNWRCPRNPHAGGAEFVTHEVARRLVQRGDYVEWFSASFPGAPAEETLDGVRLVRAGRQWTVHWSAFRRYWGRLSSSFDVVVDEVNTVPFFAPLWSDIPTVMFIHQLAREVWWYESAFPLNAVGFVAEPVYLRAYRNVPVLTVSESTRNDLSRLGFRGSITIIPEGVEPISVATAAKLKEPTFLYVGRLAPSKRVEDIVHALAYFRRDFGVGRLRLIGVGPSRYTASLVKLARGLGVEDSVTFMGRVSAPEKHRLMSQSNALLMTSVREGWGLVVTEANACGTPAIVYDVPGLRDSVRHESTGLVVAPQPADLAQAMIRLTRDPQLHDRLSAESLRWSDTLTFDETARVVAETLDGVVVT